jgi:hypothetical protein
MWESARSSFFFFFFAFYKECLAGIAHTLAGGATPLQTDTESLVKNYAYPYLHKPETWNILLLARTLAMALGDHIYIVVPRSLDLVKARHGRASS